MDEDHNKIMEIVRFVLFFKICKLAFTVLILVFLVAMIGMLLVGLEPIFFDVDSQFWLDTEHFDTAYPLRDQGPMRVMLGGIYYATTTLSTVGLGDLHPKSSYERVLASIIMVTGVSCFSYIMEKFFEIVNAINDFNQPIEDQDGLTQFFGVLANYNGSTPIKQSLRE